MNKEFQKHKRSDTVKWIAVFLVLCILGVSVSAALTKGFTDANPYGWFNKKPAEIQNPEAPTGGVVSGEIVENGVLLSAKAAADGDVVLVATVNPEYAGNPRVIWSLESTDPEDEPTSPSIENAVRLTVDPNNPLRATVTKLANFNRQISVVVAAEENPLIKAICVLDCMRNITAVDFSSRSEGYYYYDEDYEEYRWSLRGKTDNVYDYTMDETGLHSFEKKYFLKGMSTVNTGTVDDSVVSTFSVNMTNDFKSALTAAGVIYTEGNYSPDCFNLSQHRFEFRFNKTMLSALVGESAINDPAVYTKIRVVMNTLSSQNKAVLVYSATRNYTYSGLFSSESFNVIFNASSLGLPVESVALNQSNIVL